MGFKIQAFRRFLIDINWKKLLASLPRNLLYLINKAASEEFPDEFSNLMPDLAHARHTAGLYLVFSHQH